MAHLAKPDVSSYLIAQAAQFFSLDERFVAEELLLKGQTMEPRGPVVISIDGRRSTRSAWYQRLGRLYAQGVLGMTNGVFGVVTTVDNDVAKGPFGQHARNVLATTKDDRLLVAAASFMYYNAQNVILDFDHRALARDYLDRAVAMNPTGAAKMVLERLDHDSVYDRMVRTLGAPSDELADDAFAKLSDEAKLRYSYGLLWSPHGRAMRAYQQKDNDSVKSALASFQQRAEDMLVVAARAPRTDMNSRVAADAHIALGTLAMRRGKRAEAVEHLQQAALASRSAEGIEDGPHTESLESTAALRLTHELLDAGERESVAAYYTAVAPTLNARLRAEYGAAAEAIRGGRMPAAYQRYLARLQ
jgi:tetratricopeptide (TPR) repeat protein